MGERFAEQKTRKLCWADLPGCQLRDTAQRACSHVKLAGWFSHTGLTAWLNFPHSGSGLPDVEMQLHRAEDDFTKVANYS